MVRISLSPYFSPGETFSCPNCGSLLTPEWGDTEVYCDYCHMYIDIPKPEEEKTKPVEVRAKTDISEGERLIDLFPRLKRLLG